MKAAILSVRKQVFGRISHLTAACWSLRNNNVKFRLRTLVAASSSRHDSDPGQMKSEFRVSRLGLGPKWIAPYITMLLELPEVQHAADCLAGKIKPSSMVDSELERASQIMEGTQRGGNEHLAILALHAELQQRLGNHSRANRILCQLKELWMERMGPQLENSPASIELSLARAKCLWYMGDFDQSYEFCNDILDSDEIQEYPIHYASALSGSGLSKLLTCHSLADAYRIRDPFRMAVKALEMYQSQLGTALTAANLNLGIAEVMYGSIVERERQVEVPMDPALKTWTRGISLLESRTLTRTEKALLSALDSRLQSNMAWGVLRINDEMDDIVPRALEFAGNALKASDKIEEIQNEDKEYFRRVLTILATTYHKAGKAVTAEGLLQTATSLPRIGCTLTKLDERSALQSYSNLCRDWDKRQGDAKRLESRAKKLEEEELPKTWQGKDDICSSLWFWTPSEFFY